MKKWVSFALVLVLALSLLAGCGSNKKTGGSQPGPMADDSIFSNATVKYADENGDAIYTFVRAESLSSEVTTKALELFSAIKNDGGANRMKNVVDSSAEYSADNFEILIGQTDRPESQEALDYLRALNNGRSKDYIIATVGNKIVLNAFSDAALIDAIDYFLSNYTAGNIEGGLLHTYVTKGDYANVQVNGVALGQFKIIRPHYNSSYITQMQIDELINIADNTYAYALDYYEDAYEAEGDYEIIVGNADRPGVQAITSRDEYSVTISGKKVYLNGGSIGATAMAVSEFTKMLSKGNITDADSVQGVYSTSVAGYDTSKYYTLKWGDEFDGSGIDTSKWYVVPDGPYNNVGMNGRRSIRTDSPDYVYVSDGKFVINCSFDQSTYIGGMLMTDKTMLYKYGYLEMSAILPNGSGLWTALWLDSRWHKYTADEGAGYIYDQEIDVNECFGNAKTVAANCHKWPTDFGEEGGYQHTSLDGKYSNDKKYSLPDEGTFNDAFHTFGCLWDEDEYTFTCDGEAYFTYKNNETTEDADGFHTLNYIRLSAAVGFQSLGEVADDADPVWTTSNKFIVDYVHVYQLDDGKQQMVLNDAIR